MIRLGQIKQALKHAVAKYEARAQSCLTCETPGACCLDAHFVNVHISRLEALAIDRTLGRLSDVHRTAVEKRIDDTIARYGLIDGGDTYPQKYACPLFETGAGCLVHNDGKPSACIIHACYESNHDLPPDELQQQAELAIDSLNARTFGRRQPWSPIPLALRNGRSLDPQLERKQQHRLAPLHSVKESRKSERSADVCWDGFE